MKYALIKNGVIQNIQQTDSSAYVPEKGSQLIGDACDAQPGESIMLFDFNGDWHRLPVAAPAVQPPSLGEVQASLCAALEGRLTGTLAQGFSFGGASYQADPGAQMAANGLLTAIVAGLPVTFPLAWRSGENVMTPFPDQATFKTFAATLLGFVQSCYLDTWTRKDNVRKATTIALAHTAAGF